VVVRCVQPHRGGRCESGDTWHVSAWLLPSTASTPHAQPGPLPYRLALASSACVCQFHASGPPPPLLFPLPRPTVFGRCRRVPSRAADRLARRTRLDSLSRPRPAARWLYPRPSTARTSFLFAVLLLPARRDARASHDFTRFSHAPDSCLRAGGSCIRLCSPQHIMCSYALVGVRNAVIM
jgi:hypothetical protein